MSKTFYFCLTKQATISGQTVKAGEPLTVRLFDQETPEKYTLNVLHEISRVAFGGPVKIGDVCLRELQPILKWTTPKVKK